MYLLLTGALIVSVYARNAVRSAIGLPGTIAIVVAFLLPLVAVALFPQRIREFFLARVE